MNDEVLERASLASGVAAIVLLVVSGREWTYHHEHRYAPGPSLEIAALALAAAVVAVAVAVIAHQAARIVQAHWETRNTHLRALEALAEELAATRTR